MITKEQLQAISDIQVLRKLYELLGFSVHEYEFQGVITIQKGNKVTTAEMCPNDIMPLFFEYNLNTLSPDAFSCQIADGWNCFNDDGSCEFYDTNPLRAIVCCLILVLQEKQNDIN